MLFDANPADHAKGALQAKVIVPLTNRVGLHSRPAGAFVRVAKGFRSNIRVTYGEKEVDGKSILAVLSLEANQGAYIGVEAVGDDAREAVDALRALIRDKFGEAD
jgi:phosphocarrier protein HPr